MPRKTTHKNLDLTPAQLTQLRGLFAAWGLTIGRGPMADHGSIDSGVEMIAIGDALFVPLADDTEYHPLVVAKLRGLAERENLDLLNRVATALERARDLFDTGDEEAS